jgi:hypothetical protein
MGNHRCSENWFSLTTLSSYFPFNLEQGNQFDLGNPGSALVDERESDDDGFSLRDLVSYNEKHNEANGEENRDGESHNRSWNCGAEGPTDDPRVNESQTAAELPGCYVPLSWSANAPGRG